MKSIAILIFAWYFISECNARCYNKYNGRYYETGAKFMRDKPMGNSTLLGIYNCDCRTGGYLYCTAFDIPCYDYKKKSFVPKNEKFDIILGGRERSCACAGGRGRFENCTVIECRDLRTNIVVEDGEYYITERYSAIVKCQCHDGSAVRGSCRRVLSECRDMRTRNVVNEGEYYTTEQRGDVVKCRCYKGSAAGGSCRIEREECRDLNTLTLVNDGEYFTTEKYGAVVECLCIRGSAARGSCHHGVSGCQDSLTGRKVAVGQTYTVNNFKQNFICTCSSNGKPVRGTCRISKNRPGPRDPCRSTQRVCDPHATCTSSRGSYSCACHLGYTGNGHTCTDDNECIRLNKCDANASCQNTVGSYKCTCNEGFAGDGFICTEEFVDHCIQGIQFCDINAECIPNNVTFSCICTNGYTGTGHSCQDADECSNGASVCGENAHCNNTIGSYRCTCDTGYHGDGTVCTKMCRDDITERYVMSGGVFVKIKNGRQMTCSCRDGEEIEGSCYGGEEPETPAPKAQCQDESTGQMVDSGSYFNKRIGFVFSRCQCQNGTAIADTCRGSKKLTITTTTPRPTYRTTPRPSSGTESKITCYDSRAGIYHDENATYSWNRRGRKYICTCTRRNNSAVSRCKPSKI